MLWRDVVNLLGDREPTPAIFLPLLELAAERHADESYFLSRLPDHLANSQDRAELDTDIRRASLGHALWRDQRATLQRWANASDRGPFDENELEDWWFFRVKSHELDVDAVERLPELLAAIELDSADETFLQEHLREDFWHPIFIHHLRRHLAWLDELETLQSVACKTWPADLSGRLRWTEEEFFFVTEYFADQQPLLEYDGDDSAGIDPFAISSVLYEQSLGFGLDGLAYCMTVFMRAVVIDFANEILAHSRYPKARGSLRCVECGDFVGRRALGYGQLYCGEACKKRAAKRRYRARVRASRSGAAHIIS